MSMAFPSSVMAAPCHLPPGEGFLFLTPGAGAGADMIRPESCPKNGIPQSASLTAPFNKGAKGRGLRIATSGFALLAMTGFFDTLTIGMDAPRSAGTAPGTGCFGRFCEKTAHPFNLPLVLPGKTQ